MKEKGGIDEANFEKNMLQMLQALFPDAADVCGKRVMIKCDQQPGRSNLRLLANLRARGVYLFPSVPNSSSVPREMDHQVEAAHQYLSSSRIVDGDRKIGLASRP